MGPGTGRSGGPRATPADTLRALAGDISEYLGPDALTAIARGLVEDAPGWEYADVLPRAVNPETGERSWAVPGMARDVAKGLWELMQGPYMKPGQNLSPEAVLSLPALAVPAGAALAPKGAIGMFAGRNAKTADLVALRQAEDMAAKGADNEAIRAATGWFKGPDEKWRFEIPDNRMRPTLGNVRGEIYKSAPWMNDGDLTRYGYQAELGDAVYHPELFRAYPELRERPLTVGTDDVPKEYSGMYFPDRDSIGLGRGVDRGPDEGRSTLLHELQHAVQNREGFAPGSNLSGVGLPDPQVLGDAQLMRVLIEKRGVAPEAIADEFKSMAKRDPMPGAVELATSNDYRALHLMNPKNRYHFTAGEVEARDVQSRADFTPDQRAATAPYSSQGIAPEDMIVLNRGGGVQASADLPIDDVSRAARADAMFGPGDEVYHWTRDPEAVAKSGFAPFSHFGTKQAAEDRFTNPLGTGMSMADLKARASAPPAEGATIPARINMKNVVDIGDDTGRHGPLDIANSLADVDPDKYGPLYTELAVTIPQKLSRADVIKYAEATDSDYLLDADEFGKMEGVRVIRSMMARDMADDPTEFSRVIKEAGIDLSSFWKPVSKALDERGVTALRYINSTEDAGSTSYIVPKPADARSRFATFDPAKAKKSDLLAGMGPLLAVMGIGAGAMGVDREPAEQ